MWASERVWGNGGWGRVMEFGYMRLIFLALACVRHLFCSLWLGSVDLTGVSIISNIFHLYLNNTSNTLRLSHHHVSHGREGRNH